MIWYCSSLIWSYIRQSCIGPVCTGYTQCKQAFTNPLPGITAFTMESPCWLNDCSRVQCRPVQQLPGSVKHATLQQVASDLPSESSAKQVYRYKQSQLNGITVSCPKSLFVSSFLQQETWRDCEQHFTMQVEFFSESSTAVQRVLNVRLWDAHLFSCCVPTGQQEAKLQGPGCRPVPLPALAAEEREQGLLHVSVCRGHEARHPVPAAGESCSAVVP